MDGTMAVAQRMTATEYLQRADLPRRTNLIDVALDENNCFSPDGLWYRAGREPGRSRVTPQPLPDIAVEIRLPSTWRYDIGPKKRRYEQHGLPELWLVYLELARGDELTSPQLPGFALAIDELFGRLPAAP